MAREPTIVERNGEIESLSRTMDAAAELGRNPVSKHQIQPKYGDEQADAGRDCRTRNSGGIL